MKENSDTKSQGLFKSTFTLASGNIVSQLITVGLTPVLTRLYDPDAFGAFNSAMAFVAVVVAISNFRYAQAIILAGTRREADSVTLLSTMLLTGITLLTGISVALFSPALSDILGIPNHSELLMFVPIAVFVAGLKLIFDNWFLREREIKNLAISQISSSIVDRLVSIITGFVLQGSSFGLMIGRVGGITIYDIQLSMSAAKGFINRIAVRSSIVLLPKMVKRYKQFPMYAWAALIQQSTLHLPVILLASLYSPSSAGLYALCRRMLLGPVYILGDSIARSLFQKASVDLRAGKSIAGTSKDMYSMLLKYFTVPFAVFSYAAPEVFSIVFGTQWGDAGVLVTLLAPMFFAIMLIRPFGPYFDLYEKQKERAIYNILVFCISLFSLFIGSKYLPMNETIALFSFSNTIVIVYRLFWLLRLSGVRASDIVLLSVMSLIFWALSITPVMLLRYYGLFSPLIFAVLCILYVLAIEIIILISDERMRQHVRTIIFQLHNQNKNR